MRIFFNKYYSTTQLAIGWICKGGIIDLEGQLVMVIEHWWSLVSTIGPAANAFWILRNHFAFFTSIINVCVCVCVCVRAHVHIQLDLFLWRSLTNANDHWEGDLWLRSKPSRRWWKPRRETSEENKSIDLLMLTSGLQNCEKINVLSYTFCIISLWQPCCCCC